MRKILNIAFAMLIISCGNTHKKNLDTDCNTTQEIEFLGNPSRPRKSNFYIIGVAHTYEDTVKLRGFLYDNGGLVFKAFKKIHDLENTTTPLPLYTEGIPVGFTTNINTLQKVIPSCVIDMGYSVAQGIDVRPEKEAGETNLMIKKFSDIFTEYCEINISSEGRLNGHLKKDMPLEFLFWLRDIWYPKTIMPDLALERNVISIINRRGIAICGVRHVIRMGLSQKLDWAIVAINGGRKFLEIKDQGMMSNRIVAERFVCEAILKLPCLP